MNEAEEKKVNIPEVYDSPVEFQFIFEDSAGRRIHGYIEATGWDDIQEKIKPCTLVSTMRIVN